MHEASWGSKQVGIGPLENTYDSESDIVIFFWYGFGFTL